ncbi:hypothetical protein OSTOST_08360 [Ostertagia ostertagi]
MTTCRGYLGSAAFDGHLYAAGGLVALAVVNGRLYAVGGYNGSTDWTPLKFLIPRKISG